MPELPEVEVTRLSFADRIRGAVIRSVWLGKPLRWPLGVAARQLRGRTVLDVRRRGKYLLLDLDEGMLVIHLGMSGSLRFDAHLPPRAAHDHFEMATSAGLLRLNDPRRFGAVMYMNSANDARLHKLLGHLGVEPLDSAFEPEAFFRALQNRKAPIKQVLLVGDVVVGVGNIYASEALFHARIHPAASAATLSATQARRLWQAIRDVMQWAIREGGSTLRDFSSAQGRNGYFQLQAMVYGRAGESCRACGTLIQGFRQGQRSTYFCASCQKQQ